MKGYLLDTNVALLATSRSATLPEETRHAIKQGPNYLSVVSYWEVVLKSMKGKLTVGDPRSWWTETLLELSATSLPLRSEHIGEVCHLPPIHQDPFDRVLIAQATVEQVTFLTTDDHIPLYAGDRFRVIHGPVTA